MSLKSKLVAILVLFSCITLGLFGRDLLQSRQAWMGSAEIARLAKVDELLLATMSALRYEQTYSGGVLNYDGQVAAANATRLAKTRDEVDRRIDEALDRLRRLGPERAGLGDATATAAALGRLRDLRGEVDRQAMRPRGERDPRLFGVLFTHIPAMLATLDTQPLPTRGRGGALLSIEENEQTRDV